MHETAQPDTNPQQDLARLAEIEQQNHLNRLDAAIYKLTKPHITRMLQRAPGGGRREQSISHDSLIAMLLAASTSSSSGGSGSAASAGGMVLNAVAFQKARDLDNAIRDSWRKLIVGSETMIDSWNFTPPQSLSVWYETFVARHRQRLVSPYQVASAADRYAGWVNLIELMFNPVPIAEFMGACPRCKAEYLVNGDGDQVRAVIITYSMALATCRGCGETWAGAPQLKLLAAGKTPHDTP